MDITVDRRNLGYTNQNVNCFEKKKKRMRILILENTCDVVSCKNKRIGSIWGLNREKKIQVTMLSGKNF